MKDKSKEFYEELSKEEISILLKAIELADKCNNYDNYVDVKIRNAKEKKEKEDEREM